VTMILRAFRPVIDQEKCRRCGICETYCPEGVIVKIGDDYQIDLRYCKGCGICANECPFDAITMVREKPEGDD